MRSDDDKACARCGLRYPADAAAGLCPRCLLRGAKSTRAATLPRPWGKYTLLEVCGEGGMGVVYRAYDGAADRVVALKMLHARELASDDDVRRFRAEARRTSSLRHEHVVRVLEVGEHDGVHFFTMDFVDGLTLADRVAELRGRPRAAALLLKKLAEAVHHAHQRLILHRDLKPANVLLDGEEPRLVDFGIARRLGSASDTAGLVAGTIQYMAPEQLDPTQEQTSAVDVYGLGAVLYELLAGHPPFEGASALEVARKIEAAAPVPPRAIDPRIDVDVERICLKCLAKNPRDRYQSAAGLAQDLGRYLAGDAVLARPLGSSERAWRWVRGHPLPVALGATALLLLGTVAVVAVSVARAQEQELRAEVLETNAFAARALSGAVLFELSTLADELGALARDAKTAAALRGGSGSVAMEGWTRTVELGSFDSVFLFDASGTGRARVPEGSGKVIGEPWSWRDYFHGAAALGAQGLREIYVSRAYRSRESGTARFSLAAPIYDDDGKWLGVLQAAIETDAMFGRLDARSGDPRGSVVTVVGRGDREGPADVLPDDWLVLLHDNVAHGSIHRVQSPALPPALPVPGPQLAVSRQAAAVDARYLDPVPGFEGPWLAGVAPVGGTHLAVIVQTRSDEAIASAARLASRLVGAVAVASAVALAMLALLVGWSRRRAK